MIESGRPYTVLYSDNNYVILFDTELGESSVQLESISSFYMSHRKFLFDNAVLAEKFDFHHNDKGGQNLRITDPYIKLKQKSAVDKITTFGLGDPYSYKHGPFILDLVRGRVCWIDPKLYEEIPYNMDFNKYISFADIICIEMNAFKDIQDLGTITLPEKCLIIDIEAFADSGLTGVNFNENLLFIKDEAFKNCLDLGPNLILPDSLRDIYDDAFRGCFNIRYVKLPKNLKYVGDTILGIYDYNKNQFDLEIETHYLDDGHISFICEVVMNGNYRKVKVTMPKGLEKKHEAMLFNLKNMYGMELNLI